MGGMRWRPLLLLFLLSVCARPDTLPPEVGLVYPQGGGVAPGRSLLAEGYAFDPSGVVSVRVNGREVLEAPSRGKPLVAFRFRLEAPSSGTAEIVLEAEDGVGNRATRRVAFTLDNDPPRIQLERTERLEGGLVRVYGRVEDNVGVERVVLLEKGRYLPLSLPKGTSVPFAVVASPGSVLIAVDAAENRASRRLP